MGSYQGWGKVFVLILAGWLSGCATMDQTADFSISEFPEPHRNGVYHKIHKGETLWRIAKIYGVPIDDIIKINNIPDVAQLEENQLVFIPGADEVKEIIVDTEKTKDDFIWPIKGKVIHYFHQKKGSFINKGIDIEANPGSTVKASRTGRVVFADSLAGYGNTVILDHQDGYYSVYAHTAQIFVDLDDLVFKNNDVARIGRERPLAFLHFEIRKNSREDNPLYYLP